MIFKGDIGTKIILNTGADLSTGTVFRIYYRKPNGQTGYWTAQKESDNTSISYTTIDSGDLDVAGTWQLQSYVEISGWKGFGQAVSLVVNIPVTEITDPQAATYDTTPQGMLAAVEQAIAAILAGGAVQAYTIAGRNIQKMPLEQLYKLRDKLRQEIASPRDKTTYVSFGEPS